MEHLYVAQGIGGIFKIGRSSDPTSRAKALKKEFVARHAARFAMCSAMGAH